MFDKKIIVIDLENDEVGLFNDNNPMPKRQPSKVEWKSEQHSTKLQTLLGSATKKQFIGELPLLKRAEQKLNKYLDSMSALQGLLSVLPAVGGQQKVEKKEGKVLLQKYRENEYTSDTVNNHNNIKNASDQQLCSGTGQQAQERQEHRTQPQIHQLQFQQRQTQRVPTTNKVEIQGPSRVVNAPSQMKSQMVPPACAIASQGHSQFLVPVKVQHQERKKFLASIIEQQQRNVQKAQFQKQKLMAAKKQQRERKKAKREAEREADKLRLLAFKKQQKQRKRIQKQAQKQQQKRIQQAFKQKQQEVLKAQRQAQKLRKQALRVVQKEDHKQLLSEYKVKFDQLRPRECYEDLKQACPICADRFLWGQMTIVLPCLHIYHYVCITKWFEMTKKKECVIDHFKMQ